MQLHQNRAALALLSVLSAAAVVCCASSLGPKTPPLPDIDAVSAGFIPEKLAVADGLVQDAVNSGEVPGAVVLVARNGSVVLRRAYGYAGLRPQLRPMNPDTVFDLASLTKVVATTTAIGQLLEEGRIALDAPVGRYLPDFARVGGQKSQITIRQLLTHTAGLPPDGDYQDKHVTLAQVIADIASMRQDAPPGTKFIYSDLSFITLGAVVEAVTGETLDRYCQENVFEPIGMSETTYRPGAELAARCAATTRYDDTPETRGLVHDPTSRALGCVAGHAGVFSTADDLARFCQMILNRGEYAGVRILQPRTVAMMTVVQSPITPRGLGWDLDSPYSIRGAMPEGSFGHTGFTGTSIWIDPTTQTFIILLTNAVHRVPQNRAVLRLRLALSNAVAASLVMPAPEPPTLLALPNVPVPVSSGLDQLEAQGFRPLEGRNVGVVCNATSIDSQGRHIIDLLAADKNIHVVALFSPEHGIRGEVDEAVGNQVDSRTGLPIYSLYDYRRPLAERYRPTPQMLQGIDTLVFDLQDVGVRCYTYLSTLGYLLETAAQQHIRLMVLDRPNPLGGLEVEGPDLDMRFAGFTGYHNMPLMYGMTIGELALLYNLERGIHADLQVVKMANWNRRMFYDDTNLPWVNPSPNIRNVREAALYPGIGFLESLPLSVGRGTDTPFEVIGAPWIDGIALAKELNHRQLTGVSFEATEFTPASSVYSGKLCRGVQILLWDRNRYQPVEIGLEIADALVRRYPDHLDERTLQGMRSMLGTEAAVNAILQHVPPRQIMASFAGDDAKWRERRAPFLLYR